jgi:UDP-N-acetylglucosamine diphosphorylase/glucosamine-1-phosphate N-acetyltransferase
MKAVILAAGRGTRLRPLTYTKPKVLLQLANKPIIQHIVEDLIALKEFGTDVDEIFIVTNYLEKQVRQFFIEWSPDVRVTFIHQRQLGGTGDALREVSGMIHEDFIMVNGDEVFGSNTFSIVLNTFRVETAYAVVGAYETETPERYGVLLTDSTGTLEDIVEKSANPPSNIVNTGVYVFSPKIFEYLERIGKSDRGEYELTDAIKLMADETHKVFVSKIHEWHGVSALWDLFEANRMKIEERLSRIGKKYHVVFGQNVEMKPGVHIEGNVIIGDNSVIGPNCYIRGNTSIGRNCRIGNGVEIKNSIVMDNSKVPHLSYIGDSVIGENCNLGAGTISGNLRHDYNNVKVLVKGQVRESDRHKIGFFAADWTKTGVGTMVYPGMILGPFSWTAPNETVDCNVEPFTLLGKKGKQKIPKGKIETVVKDEQDKRFLSMIYEELEHVKY